MKKISQNIITIYQKERIALYTQEFIRSIFTTQLKNTEDILSPKIAISTFQEKSTLRFIGEILTASNFAESSNSIKQIVMNSEKPNQTKMLFAGPGNVNKELTIHLPISGLNTFHFEQDIKAGNNANNPFSGIWASIPYIKKGEHLINYFMINNRPVDLRIVQQARIAYVEELTTSRGDATIIKCFREIVHIDQAVLDIMQKNILIQEEIFKAMSNTLMTQRPSFYFAHVIAKSSLLHQEFFKRLEPYIYIESL